MTEDKYWNAIKMDYNTDKTLYMFVLSNKVFGFQVSNFEFNWSAIILKLLRMRIEQLFAYFCFWRQLWKKAEIWSSSMLISNLNKQTCKF